MIDGAREWVLGMSKLGTLPAGVMIGVFAWGVLKEVAADRELSLLLERLEEAGDAGTARGADMLSV